MKNRLLILLLLLTLTTACEHVTPRYTIGVSQCSDDEWRKQVNRELLREAMFYGDMAVKIRTAYDDTEQQQRDIQYFIDQHVDLLIVAPNEAAPLTAVVSEAFDKGIPVITFDRNILSDKYTAYVGADNYEIGRSVGNYTASLLHGEGNVVEISGLMGSTPAIDRHEGFVAAIAGHPGVHLLEQRNSNWLRDDAKTAMEELLRKYPNIDVVYAHNDRMAAGAYEAAQQMGRERDIKFIGVDAQSGEGYGLDMVSRGMLSATFLYPTGGERVMQIARNILLHESFPRETTLSTAVVDSTNARVMLLQTAEINQLDDKIGTLNNRIDIYLSRSTTQQLIIVGSLVFLCVVVTLLLIVYRSLRTKNRLNKQLIQMSRQLEEATQAKLRFFTNVSHDFRTPLTLVADPVERMLDDTTLSDTQRQNLQLVRRNVNILLRLVNQILDFRKYENNKLELNPSRINLPVCLQAWHESFAAAMRAKHIHFHFAYDSTADLTVTADAEKLERIYFNLMSNAVKFTPENGKIDFSVGMEGDKFRLAVTNSGSLIDDKHIHRIFDRFYQIDRHHAGSGIGLALVKVFTELHGGTVEVESDVKKGTTFTVEMPVHCAATTAATVDDTVQSALPIPADEEPAQQPVDEAEGQGDKERPVVLIIDDNPDIRGYIRSLLQQDYTVIEAADGAEGIRQAMTYIPDVIVSDVMMPGTDGIACCRQLKSELQTCHIPVILLTACSLDEQRAEGYDCGADSYIAKPFDSRVLLSRIRNLIAARERLRQAGGLSASLAREEMCDMDKRFLDKFHRLIEERMNNSELNVDELGSEMGLSRTQLYRKIKSLTNYAPNELLRIARLKKAASLLVSSGLSISEICYEVGFTSPSYFTKCYRAEYGESPSEIVKRRKGKGCYVV
jgi:signal transduction histidine kinase/DNA-binding response OmpR family regulator